MKGNDWRQKEGKKRQVNKSVAQAVRRSCVESAHVMMLVIDFTGLPLWKLPALFASNVDSTNIQAMTPVHWTVSRQPARTNVRKLLGINRHLITG